MSRAATGLGLTPDGSLRTLALGRSTAASARTTGHGWLWLERTRIALLTFVATVPLLAFDPWGDFDGFFGIKATLLRLAALALVVWWAAAARSRAVAVERLTPLLLVGLLLLGWVVASTVLSVDSPRAVWGSPGREDGLLTWFVNLIVFASAITMASERGWRLVLVAAAAACVLISGYAIAQHFGLDVGVRPPAVTYARSSATLRNPVFLGGYLALVFPLVLALAIAAGSRVQKVLWSLGAGCVLAAVYFSFSRAAWGGVVLGTAALLALGWRYRLMPVRFTFLAIGIAVALAAGLSVAPRPALPGAPEQSLVATAATAIDVDAARNAGRIAIWAIALDMIGDRPWFGTGPDQMGTVFEQYRTERFDLSEGAGVTADRAHSEPLHLAVTVGIPGAFLCYTLIGLALARFLRDPLRPRPPQLVWVAVGSGLGAYMLASLVSITVPGVHTLFFLFLGGLARPHLRR